MEITTSKSNKSFSYIAFFDLDRTITKAISGRGLVRRAFEKGLMKKSDIAIAAYLDFAYRPGFADPVKIMLKMVGWVKDLPALSSIGFPVCINPDKRLKKIAAEKSWKVYYWD